MSRVRSVWGSLKWKACCEWICSSFQVVINILLWYFVFWFLYCPSKRQRMVLYGVYLTSQLLNPNKICRPICLKLTWTTRICANRTASGTHFPDITRRDAHMNELTRPHFNEMWCTFWWASLVPVFIIPPRSAYPLTGHPSKRRESWWMTHNLTYNIVTLLSFKGH